jgi:hypothetical protein
MGRPSPLAGIMVDSAKRTMPSCPVWQLSDRTTAAIANVDKVVRIDLPNLGMVYLNDSKDESALVPAGVMLYRTRLLSTLDDSPIIVIDTDCVIQKDLSHVFDDDFDIALTYRNRDITDSNGANLTEHMPFNTGVMFARKRQFWLDCLDEMRKMDMDLKTWYGDQLAVKTVSAKYKLKQLSCDPYNYTPLKKSEDVSTKHVVHYKGLRKQWMFKRFLSQDQKDSSVPQSVES